MQQLAMHITAFSRRKPRAFLATVTTVVLLYLGLILYQAFWWVPRLDQPSLRLWEQNLHKEGQPMRITLPAHEDHACTERRNFVFIKGMKCATSTLLGVFYRFGYTRNLSFVSPVGKQMYLNWPYKMTRLDYRPSSRGYNVLTDHSVYTSDIMEAIMPKDTAYISIIREPLAQLKSLFKYFKIAKLAGIPDNVTNPILAYFSDLHKHETAYKTPGNKERWCIPDNFSMTKNLMSHCHGMPLGFPPGTEDISNNISAIQHYIKLLESKFNLIMIVEYFIESLILLKRIMCWTFKDIVFVNSNVAEYDYKNAPLPKEIIDLHKNWSSADYSLYNHFNRAFWKLVSRQNSDFFSEVKAFKLVEDRVQNYCRKLYDSFKRDEYPVNMTSVVVEETPWSERFAVTWQECWMLGPNPYEMLYLVQRENDVREAILLEEQKKIPDNRTLKSTC